MHKDPDAEKPKAQDPSEELPRFCGEFIRLTHVDRDGQTKSMWIRASTVTEVCSPYADPDSPKAIRPGGTRARSFLALSNFAETPEEVLRLVQEAEGRNQANREPALAEHTAHYVELKAAAREVLEFLDLVFQEEEHDHAATIKFLGMCKDAIEDLQVNARRGNEWARKFSNEVTSRYLAETKASRLVNALRDIRLAIDKAGRDAQALVNVEEILDSLKGDVVFVDRDGIPLAHPETPSTDDRPESNTAPAFWRAQLRKLLGHIGLCRHGWLNKLESGALPLEEIERAVSDACERHKTVVCELDQQLRALDQVRDEVAVLRQRLSTYEPAGETEAVQP